MLCLFFLNKIKKKIIISNPKKDYLLKKTKTTIKKYYYIYVLEFRIHSFKNVLTVYITSNIFLQVSVKNDVFYQLIIPITF